MHDSWKTELAPLRELALKAYNNSINCGPVYPPMSQRFAAFDMPFDQVKVVIIGQDPYHGKGQANGLAFSVNKGIDIPPSLLNIFKELNNDLDIPMPPHGDLSCWMNQGVLLLNTSLTVCEGLPGSHAHVGWHEFVYKVLEIIAKKHDCIVFMLWGKHAIDLVQGIDLHKHYVIKSSHPSFYSADKPMKNAKAFLGSKPFSECNDYLRACHKKVIDWRII